MTQARSRSALNLRFAPMQTSEATIPLATLDPADVNLVLHPGEPSQVVGYLENSGSEPLRVFLRVEGDCPPQWFHISLGNHCPLSAQEFGGEGDEILPGQTREVIVTFAVPEDVFEHQKALRPGETLRLDYQSRVWVAYEEPSQRQRTDAVSLNLFVRPRTLMLSYLPALYREVDFIHRFLKIFEQSLLPIVQTLDALPSYLDPLTTPETLLPFMAHWVGWTLDYGWTPIQQRRLVRHAMEIYRWRGTRRGLRLFLHLYTHLPPDEAHISIEDATSSAFVLGDAAQLGDGAILGQGQPYHFIVRLRSPHPDQIERSLVQHIINQEKPAFATYDLWIESL